MKSAQPAFWHIERRGNFGDVHIPKDIPTIPAMSSDAERRYYYWLARQFSGKGAVVEIGPWLGASTAYIAAGIRDSGVPARVKVFDRFLWRAGAGWESKVVERRSSGESFCEEFKANLGPLLDFVDAHETDIKEICWDSGDVELLFLDAPKRTRDISKILTTFGPTMIPGHSIMVWQDFGHFPSYAILASLSRLGNMVEPIHVIEPGSAVGFRVKEQWPSDLVSEKALDLQCWTPEQIDSVWQQWMSILPEDKKTLFLCGAAMFLYDIGHVQLAQERLRELLSRRDEKVTKKWRHLAKTNLVQRYPQLFEEFLE